jgi:hypothetical protein
LLAENLALTLGIATLELREPTLRVRAKTKTRFSSRKLETEEVCLSLTPRFKHKQWALLARTRGIIADIQSPRTRLLYFIYSAAGSKIKDEPGVKSNISSALGYKSDGHFHYDWSYLINARMIEEKQGYFLVTDTGKKEFALHSTAAMSNSIMVVMGLAMVFFAVGINFGILPKESIAFFGAALILIGSLFLLISRRNRPQLPLKAKTLLKELNRR